MNGSQLAESAILYRFRTLVIINCLYGIFQSRAVHRFCAGINRLDGCTSLKSIKNRISAVSIIRKVNSMKIWEFTENTILDIDNCIGKLNRFDDFRRKYIKIPNRCIYCRRVLLSHLSLQIPQSLPDFYRFILRPV